MKDEPLIHWGIPGMKWGTRRLANRGGKKNTKSTKKQTAFSKSLEQKYGHTSVSSLTKTVSSRVLKATKVVVQAYAGYKIGQFIAEYGFNRLTN